MLRSLARFAWIYALWLSGILWFCKRSLRRRGAAVVLTFHRVLDDREFAASRASSNGRPGIAKFWISPRALRIGPGRLRALASH